MKKISNFKVIFKKSKPNINGFGLVDSILSLTLLAGIITYGVYFSSLRLSTVHSSNLIRSVNKEIERDIERLKLIYGVFFITKKKANINSLMMNVLTLL